MATINNDYIQGFLAALRVVENGLGSLAEGELSCPVTTNEAIKFVQNQREQIKILVDRLNKEHKKNE